MKKPDTLLIQYILDKKSNVLRKANEYLDVDISDKVFYDMRRQLEKDLQKGESNFVCYFCNNPVVLREKTKCYQRRFRHAIDSLPCPLKDTPRADKRSLLAQMYGGKKESDEHREMKACISEIMELDKRFARPSLERRVYNPSGNWRQPDIQCMYQGTQFAFEMQVSNTFISEMVARDLFYEALEFPLIWVCNGFFKNFSDLKAFHKDIYFSIGEKLIVFNSDAYEYSLNVKKLTFLVYSMEMQMDRADGKDVWNGKLVDFNKIADAASYREKNVLFDIIRKGNKYINLSNFYQELKGNNAWKFRFESWNDDDFSDLYEFFRVFLSLKENSFYGTDYKNHISMMNFLYNGNIGKRLLTQHWIYFTFVESEIDLRSLLESKKNTYEKEKKKAFAFDKKSNKFIEVLTYFFGDKWI